LVLPVNQDTQRKNGRAFKPDEKRGFHEHELIVACDEPASMTRRNRA
jgi:hypothetical protein